VRKNIDLSCDLGEDETPAVTAALMRQITSANIACGGHAGDLQSMQRCLRLAKRYGVKAGAHPGLPDKNGFGRIPSSITPKEFKTLLCSQITCLETLAKNEGIRLHHVKLHGALYHMVETDGALRKAYLTCLAHFWPRLSIRALTGGKVIQSATRRRLSVSQEIFADRAYLAPLTLLPRSEPGAVLNDPKEITARLRTFLADGAWPLSNGAFFRPHASTLCLHGDTPGAIGVLQKLKKMLS